MYTAGGRVCFFYCCTKFLSNFKKSTNLLNSCTLSLCQLFLREFSCFSSRLSLHFNHIIFLFHISIYFDLFGIWCSVWQWIMKTYFHISFKTVYYGKVTLFIWQCTQSSRKKLGYVILPTTNYFCRHFFCHVNFRVFHIDVLVGSFLCAHKLIFNIYPVKSRAILTDT